MDPAAGEPDQPPPVVDRGEHERVEGVRRGPVGIVDDEDVSRREGVFAEELQGLFDAVVVGSGEDRNSRRIGDHIALGVVDADAVVVDFVDHGVVTGRHRLRAISSAPASRRTG